MMHAMPENSLVAPADTARFAALDLGHLSLLLPQHEIRTLETVLDVEGAGADTDAACWVGLDGERWPVYCLSVDLEALPAIPAERRICVVLHHKEGCFGLVCEQVGNLARNEFDLLAVPVCMRMPETPIRALAVQGEQVHCVTTSADLAGFLVERTDLANTITGALAWRERPARRAPTLIEKA